MNRLVTLPSTLVKLLFRFYEVQSGRIAIDGVDIREIRLTDLRQCIGWVSQDVFLFHGTVAENIRYGSFDVSCEQITHAAKSAEAHEFIEQLPLCRALAHSNGNALVAANEKYRTFKANSVNHY